MPRDFELSMGEVPEMEFRMDPVPEMRQSMDRRFSETPAERQARHIAEWNADPR